VAVVVFVLLGGFGRGDLRGMTLVVRAVVCLSGGALVGLSGGDTMDPVCSTDARDGTASVSGVLVEYGEWLDRQRGLAPITIDNYCWNVEQFLAALPQPTQVSVSLLDAGTVTAFMVEYCRDRNTNSVKSMARSVRSFLRFAHATGRTSVGLWGAVPASSGWHLASLPRSVPAADLERWAAPRFPDC
jgi:Phage integrase, N-terminal SAM-like domain